MLDRALEASRLLRDDLYLTNVVKHFKFEPRGKVCLHKRASLSEQAACRHWLDAELATLQSANLVCLGAMAARAVFGASFRLLQQRGQWIDVDARWGAFDTVHPSFVLRQRDESTRAAAYSAFVADLRLLRETD